MPIIDEMLGSLHRSTVYSSFDCGTEVFNQLHEKAKTGASCLHSQALRVHVQAIWTHE